MTKLGLQLYTLKDDSKADFLGTVAKVAQQGYDGIEFAGYFDTPAATLKQVLDDNGIVAAGAHYGINVLESDLDAQIEYAKAIECPVLICPGFGGELDKEATFKDYAARFNKIGEQCKAAGLRFGYHIHGHEYVDFGEKTGMDILLSETDPDLVFMEPDVYWIERAGGDAMEFLKAHGDRCTYVHLKDTKNRDDWFDAEVGDGLIDIAGIIKESANYDVEWFVIEQESFTMTPLESTAVGQNNVRKLMG